MFYTYIGLPGSGKSTLACKIAKKYQKKHIPVYSNFPINNCYLYDISDIGQYNISNCCLILDEAGIDISNRSFKDKNAHEVSKAARRYWKLYRHYKVDVYVFSQAQDYDITLRRLSDKLHIIKRGYLPGFSRIYTLKWHWGIDTDGQPQVQYDVPVLFTPLFRPIYYKMFDSYSAPVLLDKVFPLV